jgi:hypothetical protein
MKIPKDPRLRIRFIYDNRAELLTDIFNEGFPRFALAWHELEIVNPRCAAAYLLKSEILQFLPLSQTFVVMGPDGLYVEAREADLHRMMCGVMRQLGRESGQASYFTDVTPENVMRALRDVASGRADVIT